MRIAYIIFAYIDPKYIGRLANKLVVNTDNEVFIHCDKKVDIKPFLDSCGNNKSIHFVKKRVVISWGGFSSNEGSVNSFREALATGKFDRFVVLTGLEYPIRSNDSILEFFEENKDTEYIRAANESKSTDINNLHKYCFYWFLDDINILKKIINKLNAFLLESKILIKFKKPYIILNYKKHDIYRGWAHIALTDKAVKYIINFHDSNPTFNKYFKSSYASGESYFHTILYNSPFIRNVPKECPIPEEERSLNSFLNVTYFEYPVNVTVFKYKSDYQKLKDSNYLFFRKVTSDSKELLDYIDIMHECENKVYK